MEKPILISGGLAVDERGELGFVNEFAFDGVKRFYTIRNHRIGVPRAWHAHRQEAKYFTVLSGSALICAVRVEDWSNPSPKAEVHRFVLTGKKPSVLFIPPGYANGSMSLSEDALIQVYSTATLSESKADDVRFPSRLWDPWQPVES